MARFRAALDHAAEAIFIIDRATGRFADTNETGAKWLRCSRSELLASCVDDVAVEFPLEPPAQQAEHVTETRDTTRGWVGFGLHRRWNGTAFPVEVSITEHRSGGRVYSLVVARECADRKRVEDTLREREDVYRGLSDLTTDAIYLTSRDGTVIEANEAASRVFGYAHTDLIGLPARRLYADMNDVRRFQVAVEERGSVQGLKVELVRGDGATFAGELSATFRHGGDGAILGYQCLVRPLSPDSVPKTEHAETTQGEVRPRPVQSTAVPQRVSGRSRAVTLRRESTKEAVESTRVWVLILVVGFLLGVIAWSGLVQVGYPYAAGVLWWAWLVRVSSASLVLLGALGRGRRAFARTVAVGLIGCAIALVVVGARHVAGLPFELTPLVPTAWSDIRSAIVATAGFTLAYALLFAVTARHIWHSTRPDRLTILCA